MIRVSACLSVFCGDKVTKFGPILRVANTSLTYYASGGWAAVKIDDIFPNCDFDAARGIRISRKYLGVFSFLSGGGGVGISTKK